MCVYVCERERVRERDCVYVSTRGMPKGEREKKRKSEYECVCVRTRVYACEREIVCVCVCKGERENVRVSPRLNTKV